MLLFSSKGGMVGRQLKRKETSMELVDMIYGRRDDNQGSALAFEDGLRLG